MFELAAFYVVSSAELSATWYFNDNGSINHGLCCLVTAVVGGLIVWRIYDAIPEL